MVFFWVVCPTAWLCEHLGRGKGGTFSCAGGGGGGTGMRPSSAQQSWTEVVGHVAEGTQLHEVHL